MACSAARRRPSTSNASAPNTAAGTPTRNAGAEPFNDRRYNGGRMAEASAPTPRSRLRGVSWRDLLTVVVPIAMVIFAAFWIAARFMHAAPPKVIRMVTGPDGSNYRTTGEKYKKIIEAHGVKVELVRSQGGLENLKQ